MVLSVFAIYRIDLIWWTGNQLRVTASGVIIITDAMKEPNLLERKEIH